jgi:hypothetical protein
MNTAHWAAFVPECTRKYPCNGGSNCTEIATKTLWLVDTIYIDDGTYMHDLCERCFEARVRVLQMNGFSVRFG